MATTLTVISATDQSAAENFRNARDRFAGNGEGFQNLGFIDKIGGASADESKLTHSRQRVLYDPKGDIVYVVAVS